MRARIVIFHAFIWLFFLPHNLPALTSPQFQQEFVQELKATKRYQRDVY